MDAAILGLTVLTCVLGADPPGGERVATGPICQVKSSPPPSSPHLQEASYLFRLATCPKDIKDWRGEPYHPQEGDLILWDDGCKWVHTLYKCFGSGGPLHSSIVFKRPDGSPAILEAGPNFNPKVFVQEVVPRLHDFYGTVLIRHLRQPLNEEQSRKLTEFALAQEGKRYALTQLLLQITPFRPRGPVRTYCLGKTCLDRKEWTCCELVGAATCAAGVLDKKKFFANAMYPRDFTYDEKWDLRPYYEEPALWYPRPQLDWIDGGIQLIDGRTEMTKEATVLGGLWNHLRHK